MFMYLEVLKKFSIVFDTEVFIYFLYEYSPLYTDTYTHNVGKLITLIYE